MENFDNNLENEKLNACFCKAEEQSGFVVDLTSEQEKNKRKMLEASRILVFASIISIFVSFLLLLLCDSVVYPKTFTQGWLVIVTVPIPIASLIFGICSIKHGRVFLKNIIVGAIVTFLTVVWAIMFSILCVDTDEHTEAPILRVEEAISIEIPSYEYISTTPSEVELDMVKRVHRRYYSKVYFEGSVAEAYEAELLADDRWLKDKTPHDLYGLMCVCQFDNREDYVLIFNTTTKELNKVPSQSGTYDFIQLIYDINQDMLEIYEYTVEYVK